MGFIYDPEVLHRVALDAVALGQPIDEMIPFIAERVEALYPGSVEPKPRWVFNNAGGAMGQMLVLHASITEYLIIFGTPIGTEGHSGRFMAEDFFFILEGEQWSYSEGSLEREVYKPGDMHVLPKGAAQGYRIPEHCFALEYARGIIPMMLPFGFADMVTSTLDFQSLGKTVDIYARATIRNLLRGKI